MGGANMLIVVNLVLIRFSDPLTTGHWFFHDGF